MSSFFPGFELERIDVGEVELRVRHGGSGPPLLLLHGHPRTHTTWHRVAPLLARDFTVVCPDLRGYGESGKPATTADHVPYSKRALAEDCVPIAEALARADARFATRWFHWFFFAQPAKPERAILADPDAWYGEQDPDAMGRENWEDWQRAIHDPATVRAMLEDYRAGLGIDRATDEADRAAGRRIACPVLVAWSERDDLEELYGDVLSVWDGWADDVRGARIASGHHMAEEAPEQLAETLAAFFS